MGSWVVAMVGSVCVCGREAGSALVEGRAEGREHSGQEANVDLVDVSLS